MGKFFRAGQVWMTRDGEKVKIGSTETDNPAYPIMSDTGVLYTDEGQYFVTKPSDKDLVRLIQDDKYDLDARSAIPAPAKQGIDSKFPIDLAPADVSMVFALVSQSGLNKGYTAGGWDGKEGATPVTPDISLGALKRHLAKLELGEEADDETGLPHLYHVAWNAMVAAIRSTPDRSFSDYQEQLKKLNEFMKKKD